MMNKSGSKGGKQEKSYASSFGTKDIIPVNNNST
jgi:hypothetical protein